MQQKDGIKYESLEIVFILEFLTEINVSDYENQDRIILEEVDLSSTNLKEYFQVFPNDKDYKNQLNICRDGEIYTTNAFLSTKVSFIFEIYQLCGVVGDEL